MDINSVNLAVQTVLRKLKDPTSSTGVALTADVLPKWKPYTFYAAGTAVLADTGDVVTAKADHTSGASRTPANWNLSASYVGASFSRRLATLGDSVMDMDSYQSDRFYLKGNNAAGWISHGNALLGAPLRIVYNGGQPGKESSLFVDKIPELLSTAPDTVLLGPPTNDLLQGVPIATIRQRMTTILNALRPNVARIIVMTALPSGSLSASGHTARRAYNAWITEVAQTQARLVLFDPNRYVENVLTAGSWAASMSTDNVHPTEAAGYRMGKAFSECLKPLVTVPPHLWTHSGDDSNLLTNGLPAGTSGVKASAAVTGSVCNNWTLRQNSGTGGVVASVIARPDGLQGNLCRAVVSGGPGDYQFDQTVNVTAGDILFADMEWAVPGDWTAPLRMQAIMEFFDASAVQVLAVPVNYQPAGSSILTVAPAGTYRYRFPAVSVPATATTAKLSVRFAMTTGTFDFAGAAIRKASAVGPM